MQTWDRAWGRSARKRWDVFMAPNVPGQGGACVHGHSLLAGPANQQIDSFSTSLEDDSKRSYSRGAVMEGGRG